MRSRTRTVGRGVGCVPDIDKVYAFQSGIVPLFWDAAVTGAFSAESSSDRTTALGVQVPPLTSIQRGESNAAAEAHIRCPHDRLSL